MSTINPDGRSGHSTDESHPTDLDFTEPEEFDPESADWEAYDLEKRLESTANSHRFPDVLHALYWREGLSQSDIADHFGITQQSVCYWMDKFEIPVRKHGKNVTYWNPSLSGDLEPDIHPHFRVWIPDEEIEDEIDGNDDS